VEDRLHGFRAADSLVGEAFDRASDAVAALWADPPHRPHLLHGDFTARNVMMRDRLLVPIDFQDLVVGFDVQDLAIALDSLGRFAGGTDLREEFRVGYESVRPWPDLDAGLLDALIAARLLHQMNLNLAVGLWETGLDRFIARVRGRLAEWMA
jgi:Ser/Thr protein kinase RdoA (MazF antagonist)